MEDESHQRRTSDPLILEMHSDIKVLLSKLEDHSEWRDKHDRADAENFKEINEQLITAKTTIKTLGWIGGGLLALIEAFHSFIPWIRTK